MFRSASIADHSMDGSRLSDDFVNCCSHCLLFSDVGTDGEEPPRVPFCNFLKILAGVPDVDGTDLCSTVCKTAVCNSKADTCS